MDLSPDQHAALDKITAELADWQPLFDNARKLRTLLAQLQDLTLAIIEGQPGQGPIAQTGQNPVGSARLTCGRGRCRPSSTQLSAKREDLTIRSSRLTWAYVHV